MIINSRVVTAGVFAASLSLLTVVAPANAAVRTILDVGPGLLVAKGAVVDVPVTFICDQGSSDTALRLQLEQKASQQRTAIGGGFQVDFVCTGESQTLTITVRVPKGGTTAFKNGTALAQVRLETCAPDSTCGSEDVSRELSLKNN